MLKRFKKDERGNFAVIAAVSLLPVMALISAAIDYSQISRHSANLQQALDAAALATAKKLGTLTTTEQLESYSEAFFLANIGSLDPQDVTFQYDTDNSVDGNTIHLSANYEYSMFFRGQLKDTNGVSLFSAVHNVSIDSTVKAGNDTLEIAMVLDNSGSMRNDRIATAKTAATALVNQIHTAMAGSNHAEPVKFSLVPFAGHVNVGSDKADENWIDSTGAAPHHHENLDWSEYPGAVDQGDGQWKDASGNWLTRFTLFDDMDDTSWKGCVEARPYPYQVNDEAPDAGTPETLFVPVFAPDEPDDYSGEREQVPSEDGEGGEGSVGTYYCLYKQYGQCRYWNDWYYGSTHSSGATANLDAENYTYWGSNWYERIVNSGVPAGGFDDAGGSSGSGSGYTDGDYISEEDTYNNYLDDWANAPEGKLQYDPDHTGSGEDQHKRQAWTFKYAGQSSNTSNTWKGPNAGCTTNAITALTSSQSTVTDAIDEMEADGSTNIPLGIMWGWRTLTSGAPFEEGRPPATQDNSKVMIIMTDGNNTYYTPDSLGAEAQYNKSYYGSYGYTRSTTYNEKGRLFDAYDAESDPDHDQSTFQAAMDEHMLEICTNAKNDGVNIYTVAFEVSDGSSVKTMLETCSSINSKTGEKQYFDADSSAELTAAFETIGNDISNLRLSE